MSDGYGKPDLFHFAFNHRFPSISSANPIQFNRGSSWGRHFRIARPDQVLPIEGQIDGFSETGVKEKHSAYRSRQSTECEFSPWWRVRFQPLQLYQEFLRLLARPLPGPQIMEQPDAEEHN